MPDFSPLPFPSNTPLQNLKIVAEDKTIYIAPGWTGSAGKTGSAGSWTGQTLGNDTTGDGTIGKPFATLKKAWEVAQENVITGDATLYIQFQKGIYDLNGGTTHDNFFPDNLYHPQGGNIIIQGDPAAVKQKYLWRVANYSWDLGKFSHWGHTGDVYLWNASGGTAHGFTGEDEGGYVAISNVSIGSAEYYDDPSQAQANTTFSDTRYETRGEIFNTPSKHQESWGNWGNHFFSHLYPHEEGDGIVGLAKIAGATSSVDILKLVFKNANHDSRTPGFYEDSPTTSHAGKISGGLNNGGTWYEVANNWPESQYSEPNGYYGSTTRNSNYPAKGALTQITDELYTVTNYPVVIRSSISSISNKAPFVIRGGTIKGIRNLMFTTAAVDGQTVGSQTLSYSLSQANPETKTPAPTFMVLDDGANVNIRHIGVAGYGDAIRVNSDSRLGVYNQLGIESAYTNITNTHSAGAMWYRANSETYPLDNAPVLMTHLCLTGVKTNGNSHADLSNGEDGVGNIYLTDATVWMQNLQFSLQANNGSKITIGSVWGNQVSGFPFFKYTLNIPVFDGSTLGLTAGFYNPEAWNYNTFPEVRISSPSNVAGNDYIGRIFYVSAGTTYQSDAASNSGWTGSSWSKSAGFASAQPLYTQRIHLYGYWLQGQYTGSNKHGFGRASDNMTWASQGYTFAITAYSNVPGTTPISGLCFGNNSIALSGRNGSYVVGTTASRGATASLHNLEFTLDGGYWGYLKSGYNVLAEGGSTLFLKKYLGVRGGVAGVAITTGSTMKVRSNQSMITANETGHTVLLVEFDADCTLGGLMYKNQHPGYAIGGSGLGIRVRYRGSVYHIGNIAALMWPLTTTGAIGLHDTVSKLNGTDIAGRVFYYGGAVGQPSDTPAARITYCTNNSTNTAMLMAEGLGSSEFSGLAFSPDTHGYGHRVCAHDGIEPNRSESTNATNGTGALLPHVVVGGFGVISPIGNAALTSATGTTASKQTGGQYSFAHIQDNAKYTNGQKLGSRKTWGTGNFPMKNDGTGKYYQWWRNDRLGKMESGGTLYKIPIVMDSSSTFAATNGANFSAHQTSFIGNTTFDGAAHSILGQKSVASRIYPEQPA